ncbi:dienelactone hydrolase family protein [Humidisolicoccus flavus]|uniref:dienelactone hydrolase family protein n=1 Tax=Humidisolicoccus flavus TaxID=3111414 RepID=UPI003248DB8E
MSLMHSEDTATHWYGQEGAPVVVLVHDWYGRLPYLADIAGDLAIAGFRVAVPDLYLGAQTDDDENAERLAGECTSDLEARSQLITDALGEARALGSTSAGLVGFSLGSMSVLHHAATGSIDAAVSYYGAVPPEEGWIVRTPLLFHAPVEDEFGDTEVAEEYVAHLEREGQSNASLTLYNDTVHGFANASIERRFNATAASEAFAKTRAFLLEHLNSEDATTRS